MLWYFINTRTASDAVGHILRPTTLGSCSQVQYPVKHFQNNFLHQDCSIPRPSCLNGGCGQQRSLLHQDDRWGLYTQKISHKQRRSSPLLLHCWLRASRTTGLADGCKSYSFFLTFFLMFSPLSLLLSSYPSSFCPLITTTATVFGASISIAGTMLKNVTDSTAFSLHNHLGVQPYFTQKGKCQPAQGHTASGWQHSPWS